MTEMQISFDDQERKHLTAEIRRRKTQQGIGYDEEDLKTLTNESTNSVYRDKRTSFPENWPSLSTWALTTSENESERMTKHRVAKFIYEMLGTMIFVWFVIFSVFVKVDIQQGTGFFLSIQSLLTGFVQAFGLSLALVACGFFSAEFNSTYTLITAFFPRGAKWSMGGSLLTALIKIIGQHIGAFLGALLAFAVLGNSWYPGGLIANGIGLPGVPGNPLGFGFPTIYAPTVGQAWLFEFLGSFMLGLLMMIIQFNARSTFTKHPHLTLPFVLLALVTLGCPITGAAFNWTRYFGQAIVALIAGGSFGALWWLYLTASVSGHFVAAIFYVFIFRF